MALSLQFRSVEIGVTGPGSAIGTLTVNVGEGLPGTVAGTWTYTGTYRVRDFSFGNEGNFVSGTFTTSGTLVSVSNSGSGDFPSWNLRLKSNDQSLSESSGDLWRNDNGTYELWANFSFGIVHNGLGIAGFEVFANRLIAYLPLFIVLGTPDPDFLNGTAAADTINGLGGNDTLDGAGGNDTLSGGAGNDSISGGTGDDQLRGDAGADTMRGGTGDDIYYVDNVGDRVIETPNLSSALVLPGPGGPGLVGIGGITDGVISAINYSVAQVQFVENITLTGSASRATGNALDNALTGNAGSDTLSGAAGNDTLDGGTGADSMAGGTGNDVYVRDVAGDLVTEGLNAGTDTVQSAVTYTLGANVERLTLIGSGHLSGSGNTGNNVIAGNSGNNTLNGAAGADALNGEAGNDVLVWDPLDTSANGGVGADVLRIDGAGKVLNLLSVPGTTIQNVEVVDLTGSGNNRLELSLQDVIDISSSTNTLRVDGNAGDTVDRNGGWTLGANQTIGSDTYRAYTQGSATLLVDTDIASIV